MCSSTINNQQSTINNQQSTINNQQSTINNLNSKLSIILIFVLSLFAFSCSWGTSKSALSFSLPQNIFRGVTDSSQSTGEFLLKITAEGQGPAEKMEQTWSVSEGEISGTTFVMENLPVDRTLKVKVFIEKDGKVTYQSEEVEITLKIGDNPLSVTLKKVESASGDDKESGNQEQTESQTETGDSSGSGEDSGSGQGGDSSGTDTGDSGSQSGGTDSGTDTGDSGEGGTDSGDGTDTQTGDDTSEETQTVEEKFVKVTGATIEGTSEDATRNDAGVFIAGRSVTLSSYYIGVYEVTQEKYKEVMEGQTVTVDGTSYNLAAEPSLCTADSTTNALDITSLGETKNLRPVENVTWFDAVWYCNARSTKENKNPVYTINVTSVVDGHIKAAEFTCDLTKNGYRLPTEAEWECAARGGDHSDTTNWQYTYSGAAAITDTVDKVYMYHDSDINSGLDDVGWYCYNNKTGTTGSSDVTSSADGCGTHQVGRKEANSLGIYDMSGNVAEWCYDWYTETIEIETVTNPTGPKSASDTTNYYHVARGGSWYNTAQYAKTGKRQKTNDKRYDLGFRLVYTATDEE